MADFQIHGRMLVKTLKEQFFNEFGGVLRVYNGNKKANDDDTLAAIRANDAAKGGELTCRANRTVGKFEQEMWDVFGIKVQVATKDDWVLVLDGITLNTIKDIPKNATRAIMEQFLAYQRSKDEKPAEEPAKEEVKEEEEADYSDILEILNDECLGYIPIVGTVTPAEEDQLLAPEFNKDWKTAEDLDEFFRIFYWMNDDGIDTYDWKGVSKIDLNKDGFYFAYDPECWRCKELGVYVLDGKIVLALFMEDGDAKIRIGNQVLEEEY